ncbi:MAG TPA: hypothetical protein PK530_08410 [Anaerolineales bacterium]|nr:hypothetical protein [Anaerolineales bacterium]
MITVRLDANGNYLVRWPTKDTDILELASRYLAKQLSLATAAQLKDVPLATIQALYAQASTAATTATGGETSRATAAETLRQRIEQVKGYLDLIILRLKGQYADNLAQLKGWGLSTTAGKRGINLRKPNTQNEVVAFMRAYVAKETGLPENQQITDPPLATLQALLEDIENALTSRITARDQRELNVETRHQVLDELLNWLQVACLILVMQNSGKVSTVLQQHGYLVLERVSNGSAPDGVMETLPEPA